MIIALCSSGDKPSSPVDGRFGRAAWFLLFDSENKEWTALENQAKSATGGAGALAVQQLVSKGAEVLIAPETGPQALEALEKFQIQSYRQGNAQTAEEALRLWKDGKLEPAAGPENKGLHRV